MASKDELRERIELLENELEADYDPEWAAFKAEVTEAVKDIDELYYRDNLEFERKWNSAHITVQGTYNEVDISTINQLDECAAGIKKVFVGEDPLGLVVIVKAESEEETD